MTDLDGRDDQAGYVTLMTLHSAKGLEFSYVFMVGMEEGIFPSNRSMQEPERMEEERRLCYVGITRAKEKLFLSRANRRMIYNTPNHNPPSPFLEEIPERLIKDESIQRISSFRHAPVPVRSGRAVPRTPISIRPGDPLTIPGVTKGFVASAARRAENHAVPQFSVGDRVMHRKFGEGTVSAIRGSGNSASIVIEFIAYGVKELALSLAPLAKLED